MHNTSNPEFWYKKRKHQKTNSKKSLINKIIIFAQQQKINTLLTFNLNLLTHNTVGSIARAIEKKRIPYYITIKDLFDIDKIYVNAKRVSSKTGIPHDVDHIIPLGCNECYGFHVPKNLQIIPSLDNIRKLNRLEQTIFYD